jgi:Aspartyl protease
VDLWTLVDSGADYLMFDNAVAARAGITVRGTTKTVTVAGGGKVTFTLATIDFGIDGTGWLQSRLIVRWLRSVCYIAAVKRVRRDRTGFPLRSPSLHSSLALRPRFQIDTICDCGSFLLIRSRSDFYFEFAIVGVGPGQFFV